MINIEDKLRYKYERAGDLDDLVQEAMNFCPICDNPVMDWEPMIVVCAFGMATLAHERCIKEADGND